MSPFCIKSGLSASQMSKLSTGMLSKSVRRVFCIAVYCCCDIAMVLFVVCVASSRCGVERPIG